MPVLSHFYEKNAVTIGCPMITFSFLWDWPYHVAWGDITVL